MMDQRILSMLKSNGTPAAPSAAEEGKAKSWGRKVISGAVALSVLDDLVIFHGCISNDQTIIEAFGEPIVRGSWYNASLAVAHKRHSVACTFPVSGPRGTGIFLLKAVCNEGTIYVVNR